MKPWSKPEKGLGKTQSPARWGGDRSDVLSSIHALTLTKPAETAREPEYCRRHVKGMETKGIEHTPLALSKLAISENPSAKSDARDAPGRPDSELAELIDRWPGLPAGVRTEILRIAQAHSPQAPDRREDHA